MTMPESHRSDHTFYGEDLCEDLIAALNEKGGFRDKGHVEGALEAYQSLIEAIKTGEPRDYIDGLQEVLASFGTDYKFSPVLQVDRKPPYDTHLFWRPSHRPLRAALLYDAYCAISDIARIAQAGVLDRVKRCNAGQCRKWFFARFAQSKFCSTRCQQQTYKSTPKWREKHRAAAKQSYHKKKEMIRRQKEIRQYKKGKK